MFPYIGKMLILLGVVIVVVGLLLLFIEKIPFLGKLPGDLSFKWGNSRVYFPIVTCLVISVILSLIFSYFKR